MGGLFIQNLGTDPRFFFAVVITVVISITLHELAHGIVAIWRGDDTPRVTGHMTLNPLVHMGGMALVMLAIAGISWGAMPINPTRLRGKYAESLVSLAGPATNLLLAILALGGLGLWLRLNPQSFIQPSDVVRNGAYLLFIFGGTNVMLAIFNLIPLPPLDGSHVVANLVPSYRRLLGNPSMQGVLVAIFFALFMGAGSFIQDWSWNVTVHTLNTLTDHRAFLLRSVLFP